MTEAQRAELLKTITEGKCDVPMAVRACGVTTAQYDWEKTDPEFNDAISKAMRARPGGIFSDRDRARVNAQHELNEFLLHLREKRAYQKIAEFFDHVDPSSREDWPYLIKAAGVVAQIQFKHTKVDQQVTHSHYANMTREDQLKALESVRKQIDERMRVINETDNNHRELSRLSAPGSTPIDVDFEVKEEAPAEAERNGTEP